MDTTTGGSRQHWMRISTPCFLSVRASITEARRQNGIAFENTPAIGRITVSSPAILRPLEGINAAKDYSKQIKPFNFLLNCHVRPFGHPVGVDPTRFHLIAPYEADPAKWTQMQWFDKYSGRFFRISSSEHYSRRQTASIKTNGDVISEYAFHAESKCSDAQGRICGKKTNGQLQRRHVQIDRIRFIGKESNVLEEVDAGMIHATNDVYTEYVDLRRDEWERNFKPALMKTSILKMSTESLFSRRTIINWRRGKSRPHPRNLALLARTLQGLGLLKWDFKS